MISSWIRGICLGAVDLVYPPLCLHCSERAQGRGQLLCTSCVELLELLDPQQRCRTCFVELENSRDGVCSLCRRQRPPFTAAGAAFAYVGPAAALVKRLKYGGQRHLAATAAAFLVAQIDQLGWALPDLIVPVPVPSVRRFFRGYNQSLLIARELASLLQCDAAETLRRSNGEFSQAGLTPEQRRMLVTRCYKLRDPERIQDKRILLVDDVMTTGTTLNRCGQTLIQAMPKEIYALSFCRANG